MSVIRGRMEDLGEWVPPRARLGDLGRIGVGDGEGGGDLGADGGDDDRGWRCEEGDGGFDERSDGQMRGGEGDCEGLGRD